MSWEARGASARDWPPTQLRIFLPPARLGFTRRGPLEQNTAIMAEGFILANGTAVLPDRLLENSTIAASGGKIVAIGRESPEEIAASRPECRGLPVIDLRRVCSEASDYSELSPIEPSGQGGLKIARTIVRVWREHDFGRRVTAVYG